MRNSSGIFPLLRRRKRALFLAGVSVAGISFGLSRMLPQTYLGEGSLIVENKPSSNEASANPSALVLTQVDVLQARGLLQRVVMQLDLVHSKTLEPSSRLPTVVTAWINEVSEQFARFKAMLGNEKPKTEIDKTVDYVRKHLSVNAKENSSVITVQFVAGSPQEAARVTNAVMATLLATITDARADQINKADKWISDQLEMRRSEVTNAEQTVMNYARTHNLSEVQGSHVSAIKLSEDQKLLINAQEELAKKQAALNTVVRGGSIQGASETLNSRAIQAYKALEAEQMAKLAPLASFDPRRAQINEVLATVRGRIKQETDLIRNSLARDVQVAQANITALQASIREELGHSEDSSVSTVVMKQLLNDLEAKRQLYVAFFTQAGVARVAAEQAPTAHVLFQAMLPERPFRTYGLQSIIIGFLAGVAGASGLITMRGMPKVNTTDDMADATGLPVFGCLPQARHGNILSAPHTAALVTETFRAMWLDMAPVDGKAATILVTSSETGEGKTTVATALARRFSSDGFRVLLVDADLRHPSLAKTFGVAAPRGLDWVLNGGSLQRAIVTIDGLDCLMAATPVDNPMKAFSSVAFADLVETMRLQYDYVIFDSPPVLHVADSVLLARKCQHVVFIVQAGRMPNEAVREAIQRFAEPDRRKMITLLTRVRRKEMDVRDYFSGYSVQVKG